MAKRRQCARCGTYNAATAAECKDCGVAFSGGGGSEGERRPRAPTLCAYNDHGVTCSYRGLVAFSTTGEGPWYCREHAERVHKRDPGFTGNEDKPLGQSIAVREWHEAMAKHKARGGSSIIDEKADLPDVLAA